MTPLEDSRSQGEPFTPLGRCRIATRYGVYLLVPGTTDGGRYAFVPDWPLEAVRHDRAAGLTGPPPASGCGPGSAPTTWAPYSWVRWVADEASPGFRLRIGTGDEAAAGGSVLVTATVTGIHGEFTTEEPPARARRSARHGHGAHRRLGRLLRFTLP